MQVHLLRLIRPFAPAAFTPGRAMQHVLVLMPIFVDFYGCTAVPTCSTNHAHSVYPVEQLVAAKQALRGLSCL